MVVYAKGQILHAMLRAHPITKRLSLTCCRSNEALGWCGISSSRDEGSCSRERRKDKLQQQTQNTFLFHHDPLFSLPLATSNYLLEANESSAVSRVRFQPETGSGP